MRRALAISTVLLAILISGGVEAAGPSAGQQIAAIEQVTQQLRQLPQRHTVKVELLPDARFQAVVSAISHAQNPDSEVDLSDRELVELGLIGKSVNFRHLVFSSLSKLVVGLYDYQKKILYVRNRANAALGPERYVIAHEYNHALEDQNFNLSALLPNQSGLTYRNSDAVEAHRALAEGDSVNVESLFIDRTYSAQDLSTLTRLESQPAPGPTLPKSIKLQFYFPYTTGLAFVQTLYGLGGMPAVNAAYHRLPQSTFEIMHPTAYLKHWKPVSLPLHAVTGFTAWKQTDDDVFGALGYDVLLRQFLSAGQAAAVVKEYRGDRYVFLENGTQTAMRLDSVWTSQAAAQQARNAFVAALRKRFKHTYWLGGGSTAVSGGLAVFLHDSGAKLVMAYAATAPIAQQLGAAPTS
ncbi:MAG TPA: hypothetical protein VKX16_12740 [Chloroflexota bacterium]|nr:hypothetical protein [Chloroflexota bacterium]